MRRFLPIIACLAISIQVLFSVPIDKSDTSEVKFKFRFGGRIDAFLMGDTRKNVEFRNGTLYYFPDKPIYNSIGQDINDVGQLRFSVASTRLNTSVEATNVLGATAKGFVEIDFMGVSDNILGSLRLRHAYISLAWSKRTLLVGQTSHLAEVGDVLPNLVTFGGGEPLAPSIRPIQVQLSQKLGKYSSATLAAGFFGGNFGLMQSYTYTPDIQLKLQFGNPNNIMYGVVGGVKSIMPRTMTADSILTTKKVISFNAGAYARFRFGGGYTIRLFSMWGQDLSQLAAIGGYAPLYSDRGVKDYGYAPITSATAYVDFDSKMYKNCVQWGLFFGGQKNLGSAKEINLEKATMPNQGINMYWRVAPRVWYHYKDFMSFGLEYMFSQSQWAKTMDKHYRPIELYPNTSNNRVTLLVRFKFLTK